MTSSPGDTGTGRERKPAKHFQDGEPLSRGPLRFRAVGTESGHHQLRAMAFNDHHDWVGRVIVEASPAGRVLRVFVSPEVEVVREAAR